jgi:hypothetical protein
MDRKRNGFKEFTKILIFCLVVFSCVGSKKDSVNLLVSNIKTVNIGEELTVEIYLDNPDWKINKAYFDCEINQELDEINKSITGCDKELFLENDTIFIGFRPTVTGRKKFSPITVLAENKLRELKILNTSFEYEVVEKK